MGFKVLTREVLAAAALLSRNGANVGSGKLKGSRTGESRGGGEGRGTAASRPATSRRVPGAGVGVGRESLL